MKTAIYIRVSTEEQAAEGFSIHAQKDKLTKYAEINDWTVIDYYIDDGISGKNLAERPEVTRLINDVKSSKIENVLVYKLDRLTRNLKDLIYLIELFDEHNCTFNSQTEHIDTSNAVGRMFVKIIGIFAEFERENLAERVTFGYEQKTKEGNYTNCNGVFGYNYLIGKGILTVNKEEAIYIKKIYNWYLEGDSMLKIAKKMQDLKVPTKRGGTWRQSTINSILTNPLYIGNIRYGVNKKNSFEVSGKNIIPIIKNDTFYNVQELINKRKKRKSTKPASDDTYYFKVLKCSDCGSKYLARQQLQKGKNYITYRCSGNSNNSCNTSGFSHPKIEEAFLNFLDNINDFDFDRSIIKDVDTTSNRKKEQINLELDKLNRKLNDITNLFSTSDIDYDTFKNITEVVKEKIKVLKEEKETVSDNDITINNDIDLIEKVIVNIKNNFINLSNHEKKIFLERFVKEIKVKKVSDKVVIENILF